jgi:hypothetical protein
MGLLGAASDKAQFELLPTAEYVFTLWDLTLENGQWGDQIKWVFLISPLNDPDSYFLRGSDPNAQEKELWQFTKVGLPKGSRAREWTEALMDRELKLGEEPDDTDLLRRRMVAYLVHKPKKSDPTIKQEAITEGSAKPFRTAPQPIARPAAPVSATPTQAEIDAELAASDALRARARKMVRTAELDETPGYERWLEKDFSNMADGDIDALVKEIREAMLAAV